VIGQWKKTMMQMKSDTWLSRFRTGSEFATTPLPLARLQRIFVAPQFHAAVL
jgi:hypothetical protein